MSHAAGSDQGRSAETGSAPIADVVKVFGKLLPRQLQDELALLKLELKDKGVSLGKGAALLGAALAFGALLVIALVAAAIAGLATVMPLWLSALIVAAFFLVVLAILGLIGFLQIKKAMPITPVQTIRGLKYDLGVVKEGSAYTEARVRREEAEAKERKAEEKRKKADEAATAPPAPTEAQLRQRLKVRRDRLKELRDDVEGRKNKVQSATKGFVDRTRSSASGVDLKKAAKEEALGGRAAPMGVAAAAGTAFLVLLIRLIRR